MSKFTNLLKNSFLKNIIIITSGSVAAQLINTLLTPVITRIYSPEEFGILTTYLAGLSMLAIIGSLKYELGIAIADDDEKAINLIVLSVLILVLFTGGITLILIFYGKVFINLFSQTILSKYMFLIPIGVLFTGLYTIFMQWSLRKRNYTTISKTKINQGVSQNIVKICLGLIHFGPIGLILGGVFGQGGGLTTLLAPLFKNERHLLKKINRKTIFWCAKRYSKFPLFSAPSQFLNTAGIQLPVIFITKLYGSAVIGYFGLANGIVNLPMILIGQSISDVFYGEAARIGRTSPDRLKELSVKLFKKQLIIGLLPLIIILLFGPFLFSLVFGQEWNEAGKYARIIALLVFTRFIFTPITRVFSIYEKQKDELFLDSFRLVMVLIAFGISKGLSLNSYLSIGLYTLAMSLVYFISFLWALKTINSEVKKGVKDLSITN